MNTARHQTISGSSWVSPSYRTLVTALVILCLSTVYLCWYLTTYQGMTQYRSGMIVTVVNILSFAAIVFLPWARLRGQENLTTKQRFEKMIIAWIFVCLVPRFTWELPWLIFFDEIVAGVRANSPWTYAWSYYLLGGDGRYLNFDPLMYTLEMLAVAYGVLEGWALYMYFKQGHRFTTFQLSLIMLGMAIEGFMPFVAFGVEILEDFANTGSVLEIALKFFLLNSFWVFMPIVTFFWAAKRIERNDLELTY